MAFETFYVIDRYHFLASFTFYIFHFIFYIIVLLTVHLHNALFFAHHGIHAEEALMGNEFEVSLDVSFPEDWSALHELTRTVNYAELFEMVRQRMSQPTALLEKVAGDIIEEIHAVFPFVKRIKISIFKLQAIIPHLDGKVGVSLEKKFNE